MIVLWEHIYKILWEDVLKSYLEYEWRSRSFNESKLEIIDVENICKIGASFGVRIWKPFLNE